MGYKDLALHSDELARCAVKCDCGQWVYPLKQEVVCRCGRKHKPKKQEFREKLLKRLEMKWMLKSTIIKINQQERANNIARDTKTEMTKANILKEKENEETKRHNINEEATKDRVNISKKEYLEKLDYIKKLEKDNGYYKNFFEKFRTKINIKNQLPSNILLRDVDGVNFHSYHSPMNCGITFKIELTYNVDYLECEKEGD